MSAASPTRSPVSTPGPRRLRGRWTGPSLGRYGLLAAATVALWLVSIEQPYAPAPSLDASWGLALVDAHENQRVFGRDIIFSAGPLGFLTSLFVLPGTLELKLFWEFAGKFCVALVIIVIAAPLPTARRVAFLVAALLFTRLFPDTLLLLALALIVLRWLLPRDATRAQLILAIVTLAFLAQFKFTLLLLASAGIAITAATRAWTRDLRTALAIATGFGAAFLTCWIVAGQPLTALPAYVRYSLDFSSGYPWAMGIDEPLRVFFAGVLTALLAAMCGWRLWRAASGNDRWDAWPIALFMGLFWFLNWKHGFTRGDGHTHGFFSICLLIGIALPGFVARTIRRWWFDAMTPLCLLGIWVADPPLLALMPGIFRERLVTAAHDVTHVQELRSTFAEGIARYRAGFDLPALRAAVGNATVDLINFEQGLLFINGLRYHPRPVFQSYAAYTPVLLHANAAHFAGPQAPEFVVVRFNTIDQRFPTLDDARVLAELPLRYEVALIESDHVLWKRKPPGQRSTGTFTRELLAEQSVTFGAEIILPRDRGHALWLQFDGTPSLVGKLRAIFYKPGEMQMIVTDDDGREARYRIVPAMAREGFLVQPFLAAFPDYGLFVHGRGRQWLRTIRFEPASSDQRELWSALKVRISKVLELPVSAVSASTQPDVRFANLTPVEIKSDLPPSFLRVEGHSAVLVHAVGMVEFAPPAGTRKLRGGFGISEGAYSDKGDTDGAEFSVEAVPATGPGEVVWRRIIEPKTKPGERGVQRFEVELPAATMRVVLRTTPGPQGKGDWDWTYWTQLEFSP